MHAEQQGRQFYPLVQSIINQICYELLNRLPFNLSSSYAASQKTLHDDIWKRFGSQIDKPKLEISVFRFMG